MRTAISALPNAQVGAFGAALEVKKLADNVLTKLRAGNATADVLVEIAELLDAAADTLTTAEGKLR